MINPANNFRRIDDPDEAEDARHAARRVKVKHASAAYVGRADLLELGLEVCRDLRRLHAELNAVKGKSEELFAALDAKTEEFAVIEEAMDDETKNRFWDALGIPPSPHDL